MLTGMQGHVYVCIDPSIKTAAASWTIDGAQLRCGSDEWTLL